MEVTNSQYKAFVDAGGYTNPAYWAEPDSDGWKGDFRWKKPWNYLWIAPVDRDLLGGKAGPIRDWRIIRSLECPGMKRLPMPCMSIKIAPPSIVRSRTAATARMEFMCRWAISMAYRRSKWDRFLHSTFGLYDMAGNAGNGAPNATGSNDQRFVLGGGWNDPSYAFNDKATPECTLDRSVSNGFRYWKNCRMTGPLGLRPVHTWRLSGLPQKKNQWTMPPFLFIWTSLPTIKIRWMPGLKPAMTREFWTIEKRFLWCGYGDERMEAYVYYPKL